MSEGINPDAKSDPRLGRVLLSHGDGGLLTRDLIHDIFLPHFGSVGVQDLDDAGWVGDDLVMTTDSFVVDPIFFPGGDIGKLAVFGTLNDLWVMGAKPVALSAGFILEEGVEMSLVDKVARSMSKASKAAGVPIVAADTKVVPKGKGDKIYVNTSGVGRVLPERKMPRVTYPGDKVLVSGTIGEHGLVILTSRLGLPAISLKSDCGPVGPDIARLYQSGAEVHMMRDPTRGGLATVLKEVAEKSRCDVSIKEDAIPAEPEAREIADILGVDLMYLPCEGRVVAFVSSEMKPPMGWTEIGQVTPGQGDLWLQTPYGGHRRLGMFEGSPLPRIC